MTEKGQQAPITSAPVERSWIDPGGFIAVSRTAARVHIGDGENKAQTLTTARVR
jgi:hypothetical protein